MSSLNRLQIIGNVGQSPEIKTLKDGGRFAKFSIATSEKWIDKGSGQKNERTTWHRVIVWGDALVDIVSSYVRKGSKLYLEGSCETRRYSPQGGEEREVTGCVLRPFNGKIVLLSKPEEASMPDREEKARPYKGPSSGGGGGASQDDFLSDEIPF